MYGSGRVICLAGSPGFALGTDAASTGASLLRWLGLKTDALCGVQRVRRISPQSTLEFLFNYGDQPATYPLIRGTCLIGKQHDENAITIPPRDIAVVLER